MEKGLPKWSNKPDHGGVSEVTSFQLLHKYIYIYK